MDDFRQSRGCDPIKLPFRGYNISWMAGVVAVAAIIVIGVFAQIVPLLVEIGAAGAIG